MMHTDTHLPNWIGYHTLLSKKSIPQLSKVVYLPIIDAAATEFSTINTIQRSKKIADELSLQYICLVFDEAIYSKIQQIRWKDVTYMDRFIVRMAAFHMAMSFCGAIAKLFGDGGLKVSLYPFDNERLPFLYL
jgi:predicted Na+-dependent transporter